MIDDGYIKDGLVFAMSGGLLVDVAKNNTITNNGATLTTDHNGRANRAYYTNMQSQYVGIANSANIQITGNCTLVWRGKIGADAGVNKLFVNKHQDINNTWSMSQAGLNPTRIRFGIIVSSVVIVDIYYLSDSSYNSYQEYVWVLDSVNGNRFYINAVQKTALYQNVNTGNYGSGNTANLRLGAYVGISTDSNVIHEDFLKYDRCLSANEVAYNYNYWLSH